MAVKAMEQLLAYLQSIHPLSTDLVAYLGTVLKTKKLAKREMLLGEQQICKNIYFVSRGLVRCYYLLDATEVSSWFMKEGDVIVSVESFYTQKPSDEIMQALEECELYYISYDELQYVYKHYPEFNFIGRVLIEKYYILSERRLFSLRMQKASERYRYLLDYHPELILRVPSKFLASYLGITEETLSRIRSGKK
jgi:CRP-like cAMP-binding protein